MRRADNEVELEILDRLDLPFADAERGLLDLRRGNRILFGWRAVVGTLLSRMRRCGPEQTLLDVAAGSGDVGSALSRSASRRGVRLRVIALDRKLSHLTVGRRLGEVSHGVVACARELPFADGAFDWTLSTLFFHHLDRRSKRRVCTEMKRVARRSAVIIDLRRARWVAAAVRLLLPLIANGRIARRDGYTSVRRSWTLSEWRTFLEPEVPQELRHRFPARVSVVLEAALPETSMSPVQASIDKGSSPP